jgi:LuxR family maltose regulon positive regulatory protein
VGTTADVLATDNVERKSITPDILGALVEVTVLRGNLAVRRYDIPLVLELMQRVLPYTGDDRQPYLYNPPSALRTVVIFNMALAYELSGQVKAASQAFVQATKLGSEQHNHFIVMYSMSHLVELLILQGQLREADKTCQQALQRDSEMAGPSSQIIGFAHVCLSNLLYERNELEMALTHLQDGISLLKPWGDLYGLLFGYIALARIKSAQGDWQSTFEAVDELIELCSTSEAQTMFPRVEAFRASLWIKQGNLDAAQQWAETSGLSADGDLVYLREGETITLARVLIAQEKLDCAMQLLTRLLAAAQDGGRDGQVIEILTLEAVALKTQGKQAEALTALKRALVLGEPEGYIRTFIDKGEAVVALLRQAKGPGIALNYVAKLLAASEVEAEKRRRVRSPAPTIVQPLIEPLSRRELEVLRLMAAGLSNRQIADKLYLSINTVKWYTRHIFGKLGVSRRTQAVNCAHALDIL